MPFCPAIHRASEETKKEIEAETERERETETERERARALNGHREQEEARETREAKCASTLLPGAEHASSTTWNRVSLRGKTLSVLYKKRYQFVKRHYQFWKKAPSVLSVAMVELCQMARVKVRTRTFDDSHPHTLTPAHPQTLTLSHPHTLTPAHPHTLTPSHPHDH